MSKKRTPPDSEVELNDYAGLVNFILRRPRKGKPNAVVYQDSAANVLLMVAGDYDRPESLPHVLTVSPREAVRLGAALLWGGGLAGRMVKVTVIKPKPKPQKGRP